MAQAEPAVGDWILFTLGICLLVATIVISVGLYTFRPWAKRLLLPSQIIALALMPFYGPSVMTGWASALSYLYALLSGGFLFLVYFSPVSQMFKAHGDAQQAVGADRQ